MCKNDDFPRGFVDFQRFHLLNRNPFRKTAGITPCWFHFLFFPAPGGLCPPLGILLRPGPWSGRLLKRCLYGDNRPHWSFRLYPSGQTHVLWTGSPGFNSHCPHTFSKSFRRTPATFEECPFEGTSFTVHYTVFQRSLQCDRLL